MTNNAFVDSREPDKVKMKCLKGSANRPFNWDTKELPQGDFYLPKHDVAIERKEASDFASSTTKGRLSEQADRMIAEHDHVYVIIENDVGQYYDGDKYQTKSFYNLQYSHVGYKSLIGMQTSLAVKRDIKIIYTESVEHTVYAVNRIFERFMDDEHTSADSGYVKTADTGEVEDVQVAMLMQVQGISEQKARAILNKADIGKICNSDSYVNTKNRVEIKEKIREVDGVGSTLAQRVVEAFQ